jgi:hypothetical protein
MLGGGGVEGLHACVKVRVSVCVCVCVSAHCVYLRAAPPNTRKHGPVCMSLTKRGQKRADTELVFPQK